jgi:hypothetical protein
MNALAIKRGKYTRKLELEVDCESTEKQRLERPIASLMRCVSPRQVSMVNSAGSFNS